MDCAHFFSFNFSRKLIIEVNYSTIQLSHNTEKQNASWILSLSTSFSLDAQTYFVLSTNAQYNLSSARIQFSLTSPLGVWNLPLFLVLDQKASYWRRQWRHNLVRICLTTLILINLDDYDVVVEIIQSNMYWYLPFLCFTSWILTESSDSRNISQD